MRTGGGDTRTRSSTCWAAVFSQGGRRIDLASTSSTSARPFPTRRGSRSARRFEAGICIYAVPRQSKIFRGFLNRKSGGGLQYWGGYSRWAFYQYSPKRAPSRPKGAYGK